jgi:hypothetical protein
MTEDFTYKRGKCPICHQETSLGGAAYTSHMRMHVRNEEATEHQRGKKLIFLPMGTSDFIQKEPYAKLGNEPLPGQPKETWDITDELKSLKALAENSPAIIDPTAYFITSGEAVKKAEKMVSDLYSLALKAKAFKNHLKKARGTKKYLETARENNRLLVKRKDPRTPKILEGVEE